MSESASKAVFLSYASPAFAKVYPPSAAPKATRVTAGRHDAVSGVGQVCDLTSGAIVGRINVTRTETRWAAGALGQVKDLTYYG